MSPVSVLHLSLLQVLVEQVVVHVDVLAGGVQIVQVVGQTGELANGAGQRGQVLLLDVVSRLRVVMRLGDGPILRAQVRHLPVDVAGSFVQSLLIVQNHGHGLDLVKIGRGQTHALGLKRELATTLRHVLDQVLPGLPGALGKGLDVGMEAGTVLDVVVELGGQHHVLVGHL